MIIAYVNNNILKGIDYGQANNFITKKVIYKNQPNNIEEKCVGNVPYYLFIKIFCNYCESCAQDNKTIEPFHKPNNNLRKI